MIKHTKITQDVEQTTGYRHDGTPDVQVVTVSVDAVFCGEEEEVVEWCETLLAARVALASAAPRHRAAAMAWLDEQDVDAADEAEWIERALTEGCTSAAIQAIKQALCREAAELGAGQALCWHDDAGADARTWDGRVRLRDDEYVVRRLADGSLDWGRQRGGYGTAWYDAERAAVDVWVWWLEGLGDQLAAEDALSGRLEDVRTGLSVVTADAD